MRIILVILVLGIGLWGQEYQEATTRLFHVDFTSEYYDDGIDTIYFYQELGLELLWAKFTPVYIEYDDDFSNTQVYTSIRIGTREWRARTDSGEFLYFYPFLGTIPDANLTNQERFIWDGNPLLEVFNPWDEFPAHSGTLYFTLESVFDEDSWGGINGDWNYDGDINILDIVLIVEYVLENM